MKLACGYLALASILIACASDRSAHRYEFADGRYLHRQANEPYQKIEVFIVNDEPKIFEAGNEDNEIAIDKTKKQHFIEQSFDVDIMTIICKYRPKTQSLPRQFSTEFNGNIFLGYRLDRFITIPKETPFGLLQRHYHRGFCIGFFTGITSTPVTPWTTNYQITDEYFGFAFTKGLSAMVAINNLTVGLGVGVDTINDRDKEVWIYQNKPWYGLTFSLNLN